MTLNLPHWFYKYLRNNPCILSIQHADLKGTFQKNTLMFSKLLIKLAAIVLHALLEANCSNISENKNSTDV